MSYRDPSSWDRRARRQARRAARWAGMAGPEWPRDRIYRDTEHGWIAGVCAGIADYAGTDPALVRLAAVICLVFFSAPVVIAYVVLAVVLKPKPPALFASPAEEDFWRSVRTEPGGVLHGLNGRFRALNKRVGRMETLVTSDEFDLRRGFRDLGP
ncbi:MAG: envelope stress response membrane protein PspC [Acetobacteraceae bacterium]